MANYNNGDENSIPGMGEPNQTDPLMSGMVWDPVSQTFVPDPGGAHSGAPLGLPSHPTVPNVGGLPAGGTPWGGIAAGTSGGLMTAIPRIAGWLGDAGRIANGISQGRTQGRVNESYINNNQDLARQRAAQLLEDALMNRANLDLRQRQFALDAPGRRATTSARGDILANARNATVSGPITGTHGQIPQISGGLQPSLLSDNTRALGRDLSRTSLLDQMKGDHFDPLPAPQIPSVTPAPQSNGLDTGLNIAGAIGLTAPLLRRIPTIGGWF